MAYGGYRQIHDRSAGHEQASHKQENISLCSHGIILAWVWDGPGAFEKAVNFPDFFVPWMAHLPTNPFLPQATPTGLFGSAPPPALFWLLWTMFLPFPDPTPSFVRVGKGFFPVQWSCRLFVHSVREPFPAAIVAEGTVSLTLWTDCLPVTLLGSDEFRRLSHLF